MPTISLFYGISIRMYYKDHSPPPFHALYAGEMAMIGIEDAKVLEGKLPHRATGLAIEWARRHRDELLENWSAAQRHQPLADIEQLE